MPVMDRIQSAFEKVIKPSRSTLSGKGIGNTGVAEFEDDVRSVQLLFSCFTTPVVQHARVVRDTLPVSQYILLEHT